MDSADVEAIKKTRTAMWNFILEFNTLSEGRKDWGNRNQNKASAKYLTMVEDPVSL